MHKGLWHHFTYYDCSARPPLNVQPKTGDGATYKLQILSSFIRLFNLDLQAYLPATSRWILDIPVILLVGNATLGNHSTSSALNATMNGSVNSLAVLSTHLVVEPQCSTWKYKRVCWRWFHPCFPCLFPRFWFLRILFQNLRFQPMHRRVLRMDAGFSMGTLQWLISCKAAVWQASNTAPIWLY